MTARQTASAKDRRWRAFRGVDRLLLHEARLQAHHALQWLGRAGTAYVPPQPDYGHTNLGWDDAFDGIKTHPFKDGARLGIRISDLTLVLQEGEGTTRVQSFRLDGHSDAEARQWLGERLGVLGLDAHALDAPPSYEIPVHAIAKGAAYDATGLKDALTEIAAWFADADCSLGRIHRQMTGRKLAASLVRCWPHHFDLATLITISARKPEPGYVGAGLSPGDGYYGEPYFYVSVYPQPAKTGLPALPKLGHWHTHEFTAAIAPAQKIVAAGDPMSETDDFLRAAVDSAIEILS